MSSSVFDIQDLMVVSIPAQAGNNAVTDFHLDINEVRKVCLPLETCARHLYIGTKKDVEGLLPKTLLSKSVAVSTKNEALYEREHLMSLVRAEHGPAAYAFYLRFLSGIEGGRLGDYHTKTQTKDGFEALRASGGSDDKIRFFEQLNNMAFDDAKKLSTIITEYRLNTESPSHALRNIWNKSVFKDVLYFPEGKKGEDIKNFVGFIYAIDSLRFFDPRKQFVDTFSAFQELALKRVPERKINFDIVQDLTNYMPNKDLSLVIVAGQQCQGTINDLNKILNPKTRQNVRLADLSKEAHQATIQKKGVISRGDIETHIAGALNSNKALLGLVASASETIAKQRGEGKHLWGGKNEFLRQLQSKAQAYHTSNGIPARS